MNIVDIEGLNAKLNKIPVMVKCEPLSLAFLDDLEIICDLKDFINKIDSLQNLDCHRIAILDYLSSEYNRFPVVELSHDPYNEDLSEILFNKYNTLSKFIFSQKQISKIITSDTNVDVIFLILVDGLSYEDCKTKKNVQPCLVNGATLTNVGFQNIIGKPPIAYKLFKKNFKNRLGFSYWSRENELTNILFKTFDPDIEMNQVDEFDNILLILEKKSLIKTYVQILLSGLDEICHKNWGRPPINAIVSQLFDEYIPNLSELILSKNLIGLIYLVSDHGILWKPNKKDTEKHILLVDKRAQSKRFLHGHLIHDKVKHVSCYGKNYSLLKYPYIFKKYRKNEWGTHGGISYFESIVPFLRMEVY